MHDAFAVRSVEGVGHFDAECQQPFQFERGALNEVLQGFAAEAFHDDKKKTVVLANFVDGANVGMVQSGGGAGLAAKTLDGLGILG